MFKTKIASYIVCDGCQEETDLALIEKTVLVGIDYHHLCCDCADAGKYICKQCGSVNGEDVPCENCAVGVSAANVS
jgi:hypothetical protein